MQSNIAIYEMYLAIKYLEKLSQPNRMRLMIKCAQRNKSQSYNNNIVIGYVFYTKLNLVLVMQIIQKLVSSAPLLSIHRGRHRHGSPVGL